MLEETPLPYAYFTPLYVRRRTNVRQRADEICSVAYHPANKGLLLGYYVSDTNRSFPAKADFMADANLRGPRARSGERITRCPYCVEGGEFKAMTDADSADRHLCARCGHVAIPSDPQFECSCAKCIGLRLF
jgi:hypothetical protein